MLVAMSLEYASEHLIAAVRSLGDAASAIEGLVALLTGVVAVGASSRDERLATLADLT
jgi:hypothetical protein